MATKSYERELGGVQQKLSAMEDQQKTHVADTKQYRERMDKRFEALETKMDEGFAEVRLAIGEQKNAMRVVIAIASTIGAGARTAVKPLLMLLGFVK